MAKRMTGFQILCLEKLLLMKIKKLVKQTSDIFSQLRKDVYLYDANTLTLISQYNSKKDFIGSKT
jgi:hypothetical protein